MLYWTIISSVVAGLAGLAVYLYYLKKGQFDDPESVKYQIFRDDNPDS